MYEKKKKEIKKNKIKKKKNLPCSVGDVGSIPGGGTKVLHATEHN